MSSRRATASLVAGPTQRAAAPGARHRAHQAQAIEARTSAAGDKVLHLPPGMARAPTEPRDPAGSVAESPPFPNRKTSVRRVLLPIPSPLPSVLSLLPLLGLYVAVQAFRLAETPLLNPDEAAYTEPAWTLLTAGRFGAPMYAGMFAIDERWYFLWPGYAVLAAVPYALWGVDVLAVRLLSAAFGAVLLAAVWSLKRQVAGPLYPPHASSRAAGATALTAAALVLAHPTVLFLSRFGRPEIAVAALAVASSA